MQISLTTLLALVSLTSACTKPTTKPVIDNNRPFGIQIENKKYPAIHNKNMNLWAAGGGDQHLYLSPAGAAAFNLQLIQGSITQGQIHTVLNGEVSIVVRIRRCGEADERIVYTGRQHYQNVYDKPW
jgi:hypothetical protein